MMLKTCLLLSAIAGAMIMNGPDASAPEPYSSSDELILPPAGMVEGRLENGLGYMLMNNGSPSRMIECRLVFRAGSVLETDGNRGAAHFLEHMAFGGTGHFPKRKLVEYLESLGAQYGIGINAFTGYDRTVYMFSIPSDDPQNLDNALLILKDWISDITIDPRKVEREKGIILEELRSYDVGDDFYDLKIGSGAYSKGIPLGTADDISRMTAKTLHDFHKTWYTLDRATVVMVGDIDAEYVEDRIGKVLGTLEPTVSPDCPDFPLEYPEGISVKGVCDTLANRMGIEVMIPHKTVMKRTLRDAVQEGRNRMLVKAVSRRFSETGLSASVSDSWYLADKNHFVISADGRGKEEALAGLHGAVAELYRLSREGFCDGEMELLKTALPMSRGGYCGNSSGICDDVVETALFGDRTVTDPEQTERLRKELEETSSADLQKILSEWLDEASVSSLVAYKYNPLRSDGISASEIGTLWADASCCECAPFTFVKEDREDVERTVIPDFLLQERPCCGDEHIVQKTYFKNIGVTDVLLDNGFRFVLRPTADEEHKVQMQLFAPGGLSLVPEDDFALYEGMAGYMELGGIEKMDDEDYFSLLPENEIGILLAMESYWHGMIASAPASSLRLMLNLIYERMLRPRLNYDEFEEIRRGEIESYGEKSYLSKLMEIDVQRQLNMQIDSLMGNLMYGRRTTVTKDDLAGLDLDDMAAVYKKMFSNPSGMTCVACGDFDVDAFLKEALPLFGSMAPGDEPNRMGKSHFRLPETTRRLSYPNADETQTVFDYIRFGQYEPSLRSGLKLKLMNNLIRNRLLTVLREQESLVYSPYASLFYTANPDRIFYMDINASVDRNNTRRVHEVLDGIIRDLQKNKASEKELDALKKIFIVNKRNYLEDNATSNWKTYLVGQLKNDETLVELDEYETVLYSITSSELRDEFRRCFDTGRYMILSIGPF